ncbi:unnamed protein product [Trypanosoma congolense IL3000]|uniref:WGS project CAEQ00000000 data, annotated contig 1128 n=1 Tax=Trypanosoma congolense (strain IL3000) TaxID=1068625 RepID=F9W3Y9_TRYCI|nr:unnamed protein product [Trypanosoma congolense IL3000]
MLSGRTPFYSSVNSEIYDNVLKAELDFSDPCFTPEAAALIERLLQSHPSQRLDDAEAIKAHPYFASVDWAALEAKKVPAPIQLDLTMSDVRYIKWKFTSEWATIPKPSDVTRDTVDMLISRFSNFAHVSDEAPPTSASGQAANGEEQREQDDTAATTTTPRGSRDVVGLWSIASVEMRTMDGKVVYPWGSKVRGVLAYFPDGQVSLQIAAQMRPCLRHHLAERATREELIEVCNSYMACFGTYETDAGANTIAHRLHGSLGPNLTNSTQKYTYKLEGSDKHGVEKLKLYSSFNELPGEHMAAQTILTWKRVSTF